MQTRLKVLFTMLLILFLYGCAFDLAHVRYKPAAYVPSPEVRKSFVINESMEITEGTCYDRTLRKGKKWNLTGRISEERVYLGL